MIPNGKPQLDVGRHLRPDRLLSWASFKTERQAIGPVTTGNGEYSSPGSVVCRRGRCGLPGKIEVSAASRISWLLVACQWLGGLQLSDALEITQKAAAVEVEARSEQRTCRPNYELLS